jgi:hypothetical protein
MMSQYECLLSCSHVIILWENRCFQKLGLINLKISCGCDSPVHSTKKFSLQNLHTFRTSWVSLFYLLTTNDVDKNRKIFKTSRQENMWDVPMFFPCTRSSHVFHISTLTSQETLVAWNIFFLLGTTVFYLWMTKWMYLRFEVLKTVNIKYTVVWDVMSYSVAGKYQNVFHPEDRSNRFLKTLVSFCQSTVCICD